jgi:transposase-like protein
MPDNNRAEQDHRGIKGRYGPMRGFKSLDPHRASVDVLTNSVTIRKSVHAVAGTFQTTHAAIVS